MVTADLPEESRRFFLRRTPRPLADLPSAPVSPEPSLPDADRLLAPYEPVLRQMESVFPLQTAVLRDLADRVRASLERYRAVRDEEAQRLRFANEDARCADESIDEQVASLVARCDRIRAEHDAKIDRLREERARARQLAVAAYAAAGMDTAPLRVDLEDEEPPLIEGDIVETTPPEATVPVEPAAKRPTLFQRVASLTRRATAPAKAVAAETRPEAEEVARPIPNPIPTEPAVPNRLVPSVGDDDVRHRIPPKAALAVRLGLSTSDAAETVGRQLAWLEWVALLVSGAIFGISMALLVDVLDPRQVMRRPASSAVALSVTALLGSAMLWVIGRTIRMAMAFAAESRFAGIAADARLDAARAAKTQEAMGRKAIWIAFLLLVLLVVIEAVVERFGILGALESRLQNARILAGQQIVSTANSYVLWALSLAVSFPYIALHALHGWVAGRQSAFGALLDNAAAEADWEARRHAFEIQTEQLRDTNDDLLRYRRERLARTVRDEISPTRNPWNAPPLTGSTEIVIPPDAEEKSEEGGVIEEANTLSTQRLAHAATSDTILLEDHNLRLLADRGWPLGSSIAAALALAEAREAASRVRRAYAQRRDALRMGEEEIRRWRDCRQTERTEPTAEARQRVDAAHAAFAAAVKGFDARFHEVATAYEKRFRPGIIVLLWRFLFAR